MKKIIRNIHNAMSHMFYPHICLGCGTDQLSIQQTICAKCFYQLPLTDFFLHADNPVEKTFWGRLPIKAAGSWVYFSKKSPIQHMLHALKYKGNDLCGIHLGKSIGHALQESVRFANLDGIIPLPLYAAREKQRGYNQSMMIAQGIAEIIHLPIWDESVRRNRPTASQTKKTRAERWQNMFEGFEVIKNPMIQDKNILLVDDVITTGASLEACGQCLVNAGIKELFIATVAYTTK